MCYRACTKSAFREYACVRSLSNDLVYSDWNKNSVFKYLQPIVIEQFEYDTELHVILKPFLTLIREFHEIYEENDGNL